MTQVIALAEGHTQTELGERIPFWAFPDVECIPGMVWPE